VHGTIRWLSCIIFARYSLWSALFLMKAWWYGWLIFWGWCFLLHTYFLLSWTECRIKFVHLVPNFLADLIVFWNKWVIGFHLIAFHLCDAWSVISRMHIKIKPAFKDICSFGRDHLCWAWVKFSLICDLNLHNQISWLHLLSLDPFQLCPRIICKRNLYRLLSS